jgi:hypothetical protein
MFVLVSLVLPGPVAFLAGASCEAWEERERQHAVLELEDLLVQDVAVYEVGYLPAAFRGYTFSADTVLLAPDADYVTLAHELAHTAQIAADGAVMFSLRYAKEWYWGLWQGCSIADARRAVSYEQAAEEVAHQAEHRYLDVELWHGWRHAVLMPGYVLALEAHVRRGSPVAGTGHDETAADRDRVRDAAGKAAGSAAGGAVTGTGGESAEGSGVRPARVAEDGSSGSEGATDEVVAGR